MDQLILVSNECIWKSASHAAFTDLIRYKGELFCVFREAKTHHHETNGVIRLLVSKEGVIFREVALLEVEGLDLRDPKLSITPEGQLMLLVGASKHDSEGKQIDFRSMVSFSSDGRQWSEFKAVLTRGEWLWRVTWHQGIGYGISYLQKKVVKTEGEPALKLFSTRDGLDYQLMTSFNIPGRPSEATIRFSPTHQMVVLQRRDGKQNGEAWVGLSYPPYEDWIWNETKVHLGGPNFLILPEDKMWAAGRGVYKTPYHVFEKTVVLKMSENAIHTKLFLPSEGDTSYPGMLFEDPYLLISYYTTEGQDSAIYLAKVAPVKHR